MSYRIRYQSPQPGWSKSLRLPILTILCFLLFVMLVNQNWQEGADYIKTGILFVQKSSITAAMDQFAGNLHRSESLSEVFSSFFEP